MKPSRYPLDASNPLAFQYRGAVEFELKDYSAAADDERACVRIEPDNAVAYEILGDALHQMGLTNDALSAYSQALHPDPRNTRIQAKIDALRTAAGQA